MIVITHMSWADVVNLTVVFAKLRFVRGFPRWEIPAWLELLEETTREQEIKRVNIASIKRDCRCVGLDGDCIPECAEINKAQA